MKKFVLLFSFFLSIVTFTYAGGYCNFGSPVTNNSGAHISNGTNPSNYNIGETQSYYMCVSVYPHSGYDRVGWSIIRAYDKNNQYFKSAAHYPVMSAGETQVSMGYVYVSHFTWEYGLFPGQTATAAIWW